MNVLVSLNIGNIVLYVELLYFISTSLCGYRNCMSGTDLTNLEFQPNVIKYSTASIDVSRRGPALGFDRSHRVTRFCGKYKSVLHIRSSSK